MIYFKSGRLSLEGLLEDKPGDKCVIVTHPHPLYGGDMYNNVVDAICNAFQKNEYACMRFNFRGVGGSEGAYDDGKGEQEDVEAAIDYVCSHGKKQIDLAGYSFGAWVNAFGLDKYSEVDRVLMVSPPVNMMDFSSVAYDSRIRLVIAGSNDEYGNPESIREAMKIWNPDAELRVIQNADHFYWGKTGEIVSIIEEFLKE